MFCVSLSKKKMPKKVRTASEPADATRKTKKTHGPGKPKSKRALNLEEIGNIAAVRREAAARRQQDEESLSSTLILDEAEEEDASVEMTEEDVADGPTGDGFLEGVGEDGDEDEREEEEGEETVYDNSESAAYQEMIDYCKLHGPGRGNQMVKGEFKYYKNEFRKLIEFRSITKIHPKLGEAIKQSMQERYDSDSRALEKIELTVPDYENLTWKLKTKLLSEAGREDFEAFAAAETEREREKIAQVKESLKSVKGPNFHTLRKNHRDMLLSLPYRYDAESFHSMWKGLQTSYAPVVI